MPVQPPCLMQERQGLPVFTIWNGMRKHVFLFVILITVVHTVGILWYYVDPNYYGACYGRDICYCAQDNGLLPGGLLDRWCTEWLYPDTGGIPPTPSATLTPTPII